MISVKGLISTVLLSVMVSACGASQSTAEITQPPSTLQSPAHPVEGGPSSGSGGMPSVGQGRYIKTLSNPQLTVNIGFPKVDGNVSLPVERAVNAEIMNAVKGYVSSFANSLGERANVVPSAGGGSGGSQLSGSLSSELVDSKFVSFKFLLTSYASGAASPSSQAKTLTFDLATGKTVQLGSLFASPGYLAALSTLSSRELEKKLGQYGNQAQIAGGTQPYLSNFSGWNLVKKGLEITFSQGQVAAAASGVISIVIPYSDLSHIAKKPGPLSDR